MRIGLALGMVVFGSALIGGPFITAFAAPEPASWWIPALIRVVWLTVGAAACIRGLQKAADPREPFIVWYVAIAATAAALCFNPALDLIRGPLRLHGRLDVRIIEDSEVPTIIRLTITAADGSPAVVEAESYQCMGLHPQIEACKDRPDVDVVALRHLEVLLAVTCP